MNKGFTFTTVFLLMLGRSAEAQLTVTPLVQAENAFEALSHQVGLKGAFLFFADSGGQVFTQKGTANAHTYWNIPDSVPGYYNWAPGFAEMSNGGDWGYTTGPSEFRKKSLQDTVSRYGQYTTVWHKDAAGNWKYLLDIGTEHGPTAITRTCRTWTADKVSSGRKTDTAILLQAETSFNQLMKQGTTRAYEAWVSSTYLLNCNGHLPITGKELAADIVQRFGTLQYRSTGIHIAPAGDLAVVYGRVTAADKRESNYLRIWRQEKEGWKVALDVLQL